MSVDTAAPSAPPSDPLDNLHLRRHMNRRRVVNMVATTLVVLSFVLAVIPLVSVLGTVIARGLERLSPYFLTHSMRGVAPQQDTGGIYHAIIGTIEQVGIATLISVPIALLAAIYLVEYGRGKLAKTISFFVDVMTGLPSIVAGLFIYTLCILTLGGSFAGIYGALALAILMLPVVVRSTEEMLRLVPNELRESSYALGVARWRTVLKIVIPTALPGIMTGIMLGVARVTGETAPLLLTTFFTTSINTNPFEGAQTALPQFIYVEATRGLPAAVDRAWAAALTLILIVMLLNLVARLVAWRSSRKQAR